MGRLKSLKPRLELLAEVGPKRLDAGATAEQVRSAREPWRPLYRSKRWRALRQVVLKRAGWRCEQTGELLIGKDPEPNSPVIDHKIPHHGDLDLFWDESNLQAVSRAYHDGEKKRLERRGLV